MLWRPDKSVRENIEDEEIEEAMQHLRRSRLFHISTLLDIDECKMEFIHDSPLIRMNKAMLYHAQLFVKN